jgi:hypothetical protein
LWVIIYLIMSLSLAREALPVGLDVP